MYILFEEFRTMNCSSYILDKCVMLDFGIHNIKLIIQPIVINKMFPIWNFLLSVPESSKIISRLINTTYSVYISHPYRPSRTRVFMFISSDH